MADKEIKDLSLEDLMQAVHEMCHKLDIGYADAHDISRATADVWRKAMEKTAPLPGKVQRKGKAVIFARDIPHPLEEIKDLYFVEKWLRFDNVISTPGVEAVYVAFPDVLGDFHIELLVNLSKIAALGLALHMGRPSPLMKNFGAIKLEE